MYKFQTVVVTDGKTMSLSTQERQTATENPFAIFGPQRPYPSSHAYRFPQSSSLPKRPVPASRQQAMPALQPVPASRPACVRKKASNLLKRIITLLIVLAVVFSLLPTAMQKKCYALLGWKQPESIQQAAKLPVAFAYISSPFGKRWWRQHQGIDLAAPHNASIYAASSGTVVYSGWESGYGKSVVIDHGNGIKTRYAHCSKLLVRVGSVVKKGALIAKVGSTGHSTGPHLHFEVIVNGVRKNPAWYYAFQRSNTPVQVAAH
jgi:murein DD-endopeptidase MepM/ murein hydrolase activator NlpD